MAIIPSGLERFIAERRAEGFTHVVIDKDGGCFGWGNTPDQAWHMAQYFAHNRLDPAYLSDCQLFDAAKGGGLIEDWDRYTRRHRQ